MKRIIRILIILLVISSLTGIMSSCVMFKEPSHANKPATFKHQDPLPKRYIVNNGEKMITK